MRLALPLALSALLVPSSALWGDSIAEQSQLRSLGLDVSAWQGNIAQSTWNNIRNIENREFVFIRASRGGTTGYYNQSDPNNNLGQNTLSQRYDDPYFVQNITRATNAGMFAGSYHFSRPDIIETTLNSGGIRNTGTDEANHFIQMAGAWMRPGYLLPVHDLEAGISQRTRNELAQFAIDFSNRTYQVMGIRPALYINGNYNNYLQGASLSLRNQLAQPSGFSPDMTSPAYTSLWIARWPSNPDIQNDHPKDTISYIYGPWDDYGVEHPWAFWQYTSTGRLQSFNNGNSNLDLNVAQGGTEFLKDQLVPAVWMNNSSGEWTGLANWNSGQPPIVPVQGEGQVARVGPLTLPNPRLPGHDDLPNNVYGHNDTVILHRPNASITVTHSSGTHNIRKLYVRETLNITGGNLNIHYVPSWDSTPHSAQFSAPVTLSGSGSLGVHTLHVDATRTFTLAGGTLTFDTIRLMPHSSSPARILVTGTVNINPRGSATATIVNGAGSGLSGRLDLGNGNRTINVGNGPAAVDLSVDVPIINGALTKAGAGTMRLTASNTYTGGTIINAGTLLAGNATGSATGSGAVVVNSGGTLAGTGTISGFVGVNGGTVSPGNTAGSPGILRLGQLNMNGGGTIAIDLGGTAPGTGHDQLIMTGAATLGGTLALNLTGGFVPQDGQELTILTAASISGQFETISGHQIAPDQWLATIYDATSVRLVPALPGDANLDGMVDIADLGILAANWQQSERQWIDGDFTGVGTVDIADLGVLASNWQNGNGGGMSFAEAMAMFDAFDGVVVPEPAAVGLLGLGLLAMRRRRCA
jgi:autotransporter-associated beta strand protein